jgi:hypothetical protein
VIANGVRGTAMPAFAQSAGGMLTDPQIDVLTKEIRQRAAAASCFNPLSPGAVCIARAGQEMILTKTPHSRRELERNAKTMLTGFPGTLLLHFCLSNFPLPKPKNVEPFRFFRDYVGLKEGARE